MDLYLHSAVCLLTANFVGIMTRFGLDRPGIESCWGRRDFSALVQTGLDDLPSLQYSGYHVILGGKAAGTWRQPSTLLPPSNARVK